MCASLWLVSERHIAYLLSAILCEFQFLMWLDCDISLNLDHNCTIYYMFKDNFIYRYCIHFRIRDSTNMSSKWMFYFPVLFDLAGMLIKSVWLKLLSTSSSYLKFSLVLNHWKLMDLKTDIKNSWYCKSVKHYYPFFSLVFLSTSLLLS